MKANCWEYKMCGRAPGGVMAEQLGVCPVALESRLDGVHGGQNAGRACWVVAGTFCGGKAGGTFSQKLPTCEKCKFYVLVRSEESPRFDTVYQLLSRVRNDEESGESDRPSATEADHRPPHGRST